MVIEISVVAAVSIFGILAIYMIQTLIALQKTLKGVNETVFELKKKMNNLDPGLTTLSNLGAICEEKTNQLKKEYFENTHEMEHRSNLGNNQEVVVDWIIASIKLGEKFFNRR